MAMATKSKQKNSHLALSSCGVGALWIVSMRTTQEIRRRVKNEILFISETFSTPSLLLLEFFVFRTPSTTRRFWISTRNILQKTFLTSSLTLSVRDCDKRNCSVTRFGEIVPLWHNFKSLGQFRLGLFSIWQNVYLTLAKMLCYWAKCHCFRWLHTLK